MLSEERLHHNIELWSREDPKAAFFLPNCKVGERQQQEEGGEEGGYAEAARWFQSLDLGNSTVLYLYGVGRGDGYLAAKHWLERDSAHSIILLEDDITAIYDLFTSDVATQILEDPQAKLCYFEDLKDFDEKFGEIYWDYILTQMKIVASQAYSQSKSEAFEELKHKIVYDSAIKNALIEEYLRYGASFHRNFYYNNMMLAQSWRGAALFNRFEGVPAIICGAGPSLEKNIHTIPHYLNKAIVFGGGSALNALSSRDILPHFGIGIDPNATQQYRLSSNKAYEVPFFYRNRVHYEAFRLIHGPRLYIPGAGGYEVADWFDEQFGLEEEWIDEGHNVVNFGLEIAYRMGCRTIFLTGVDLAYTEMQAYAKGIVDDAGIDLAKILETEDFDTSALLRKDIDGEPIYTLWKWIAEAQWISEFAKEHPDLTLINCTEGGLGMPDIPNMPLEEAAKKYLLRNYDIKNRVQAEILKSAMPDVTEEKVQQTTEELKASLQRVIEEINVLIEDNERLQKALEETHEIPDCPQSGRAALAETELAEEPGYVNVLGLYNLVYSRVHNKDIHRLESQQRRLPEWEKQLIRAQVNNKRLRFLRDVAHVNIHFMDEAIQDRIETRKK